MNKYLVCFSVIAVCFSVAGALTMGEMKRLIYIADAVVREDDNIALRNASTESLTAATAIRQKICIVSKLRPAYREVNLAHNQELLAVQTEYGTKTPEEIEAIDADNFVIELLERYNRASPAQYWIDQIKQC